jgi:hypothetical protein
VLTIGSATSLVATLVVLPVLLRRIRRPTRRPPAPVVTAVPVAEQAG